MRWKVYYPHCPSCNEPLESTHWENTKACDCSLWIKENGTWKRIKENGELEDVCIDNHG